MTEPTFVIKKRSRPQQRVREVSTEREEEETPTPEDEEEANLPYVIFSTFCYALSK